GLVVPALVVVTLVVVTLVVVALVTLLTRRRGRGRRRRGRRRRIVVVLIALSVVVLVLGRRRRCGGRGRRGLDCGSRGVVGARMGGLALLRLTGRVCRRFGGPLFRRVRLRADVVRFCAGRDTLLVGARRKHERRCDPGREERGEHRHHRYEDYRALHNNPF